MKESNFLRVRYGPDQMLNAVFIFDLDLRRRHVVRMRRIISFLHLFLDLVVRLRDDLLDWNLVERVLKTAEGINLGRKTS